MSFSSTTQKIQYTSNGVQTLYVVGFYFLLNSDVVVIKTDSTGADTVLVENTDYTLLGAGIPSGGGLTFIAGHIPANTNRITIKRVVTLTQLVHYVNNDAFPAPTHEEALDKLTMITQHLLEIIGRCLKIPDGEATARVVTFPKVDTRKSKTVAFDSNGDITIV